MNGYTQTMELLHSVHSHLLDQVDKDGVRRKSGKYSICTIYERGSFSYRFCFFVSTEHDVTFGIDGKQTERDIVAPFVKLQIAV